MKVVCFTSLVLPLECPTSVTHSHLQFDGVLVSMAVEGHNATMY